MRCSLSLSLSIQDMLCEWNFKEKFNGKDFFSCDENILWYLYSFPFKNQKKV